MSSTTASVAVADENTKRTTNENSNLDKCPVSHKHLDQRNDGRRACQIAATGECPVKHELKQGEVPVKVSMDDIDPANMVS